ncbi:MAG TPA: lipopolysaccharide heptosyltransferase II [Elusimicrobiota bacterium]|nr:lipopolysaccharide heptosyltransferase II [Elusimicrobiota bacterium]
MTKKILVRAPNWLGDCVMSTPFLRALDGRYPGSEITVLCRPEQHDLFKTHPCVKNTLLLEKTAGLFDTVRSVRSGLYDRAYVLPPSFSSAFHLWAAGIPERVGYSTDMRGLLLTESLPYDERLHYVRRYLGLLGLQGSDIRQDSLHCPVGNDGLETVRDFLGKKGFVFSTPALIVSPGSNAPARRWYPDRYAKVIDSFSAKEWPTVLLLGAPGDKPIADAILRATRRPVIDLCGQTSILLAAHLLKQSQGLITNDSGLSHLAWAAGIPMVILVGAGNPRLTSPFGDQVRLLHHTEIPCVPCIRNVCDRPPEDEKACMDRIRTDEVIETARQLFGRK